MEQGMDRSKRLIGQAILISDTILRWKDLLWTNLSIDQRLEDFFGLLSRHVQTYYYAVNVIAQFQQHPTSWAWSATKRIMRYLGATADIGVIIDPISTNLAVYMDANHGDPALGNWLSISRGAYYLGNSLIHWTCRKQRTPAHSLAESELIAASDAMREAMWLLNIGKTMGIPNLIDIYIDNKAAVDIANVKGLTRCIRHIEIHDAYIRTMREHGYVIVYQISSEENQADLFTKPFRSPSAYIHAWDITLMRRHPDCMAAGECCNSDKKRFSGCPLMSGLIGGF